MKNLTALVVSFLRARYTLDCVRSLKKTYPNIGDIVVGNNGEENKEIKKVVEDAGGRYYKLDFNIGVPASRNKLIDKVNTKYVLVGDNDFLYDEEAKVDKMVTFLENNPEFDLIGGRIIENNKIKNYQGFIDIYDDHLEYSMVHENEAIDIDKASGLRYKEVDLTFNYFVARVDSIKDVPWDEGIKVAYEHSHWFIFLKKAGKKVAFSPDSIVKHKYQSYPLSDEYKKYRRSKADKEYFFKSLGIDYSKDMNGAVTKLNKDGKVRYYAKENFKLNGNSYGSGDLVILDKNASITKGLKQKLRKA